MPNASSSPMTRDPKSLPSPLQLISIKDVTIGVDLGLCHHSVVPGSAASQAAPSPCPSSITAGPCSLIQ
ncbi:hypothetical protein M0R45_015501 [Rubus argutus]|uniref:Uncharacterized protein n=1 Tax=Rubus argutus TaxID=59490 RepID=A0AAW1XPU9_RUBAR